MIGYRLFRGHFWYGVERYLGFDVDYMTLLRHPFARTQSWYRHVQHDPNAYRHREVVEAGWSFDDFISDTDTQWDFVNAQTLYLAVDLDWARLAADPVDYGRATVRGYARRRDDKTILATAKDRLARMAYVGIAERAVDSAALLCARFGWERAMLPWLNESPNRQQDSNLSQETLAKLHELLRLDLELYQFACELFQERMEQFSRAGTVVGADQGVELKKPLYGTPLPAEQRRCIRICGVYTTGNPRPGERFTVGVEIVNDSGCMLASFGLYPVNIAYHWIAVDTGDMAVFDGERTQFNKPLPTGSVGEYAAHVLAPAAEGRYLLRITLVQEAVAWFDEDDSGVFWEREFVVGRRSD
ncbi:hypothetical protein [Methylomagnum ishizawai]|uniref:hypothetical protein n=1 Tax=Methylomagnum ishizawai TaxID=1760988 RepID=UPI0034CDDFB1